MCVSYHSVTQRTTAARTVGLTAIRLPKLKENTSRITATFWIAFFHTGRARLRAHFNGSASIAVICR